MKIALISLYGVENIGIRIISSVLRREHFQVETFYLKKWVNNNIHTPTEKELRYLIEGIKTGRPVLVGISLGSPYQKIAQELTRQIKQALDVLVVWGGIHPTIMPEKCIESADIVCIGEGEYPMLELARAVSSGKEIDGIQNLWVKKNGQIKKNPLRNLIKELDTLPLPDLENEGKYYIEDNKIIQGEPLSRSAEYRIIASRGCFFNCSYCYNSTLRKIYAGKGEYVRQRSVKDVIAELEYVLKKLPRLRRIKFDDDTFVFPRDWINDFCASYKERIGLPFDILLNPDLIDEPSLYKLKEAGLISVQIGIQSGSKRELTEVFNRPAGHAQVLRFANMNKRLKLDVVYDIILDDPLATQEDKRELFEFLMQLPRPFRLFLYSLVIFPKTKIAEELLARGLITDKDIEGEATKSFKQFRVSLNFVRPKEDVFFISILALITKNFIPKVFIRRLFKSRFLSQHPFLVKTFSYVCNLVRIGYIFLEMSARGELTALKMKEYANLRLLMTQ